MNQTRIFLLFAWLMVASLLWVEWGKERAAKNAPAVAAQTTAQAIPSMVPGRNTVPVANASVAGLAAQTVAAPAAASPVVTITSDVLRLTTDGGSVRSADLLAYPQTRAAGSPPVQLFSDNPAHFYEAQSGWVDDSGAASPTHAAGFQPASAANTYALANGQASVTVPFVWTGANGVSIRREITLKRGSYAVDVRDTVTNAGAQPWKGYVYRQLVRVPPDIKSSMVNPESYSFHGSTWYSAEEKYERRPFTKYMDDGKLDRTITGGWLAMQQHHFLSAWIPQADQAALYSLDKQGSLASITAQGPSFNVAPGQQATTAARLWVGPKLVAALKAEKVPGLERAVDYSRFSMFAVLGEGLFWVLSKLHALIGNWGWAIIALVVLLKALLFPLSNAQYKSAAQMRRFQPRLQQLKERYGDDKAKYQQAMMELYKQEKINPAAGCLPIIPQILIFMTLYWTLSESVELRHAPWMGWIQDLTARDPYFILPILNAGIMFMTQHLTPPAPGMDPMQQKIMKFMPLAFGLLMLFMPAGLVLYWVTSGLIGLAIMLYINKRMDRLHAASSTVTNA